MRKRATLWVLIVSSVIIIATMILVELTASDWITFWGVAITLFLTILGSALVLSFKSGSILQQITSMKETLDDVPKIKYSYGQLIVKVDTLWRNHLSKSNSPLVLNDTGLKILETSKINEFTDRYYNDIFQKVKASHPENSYQAQQSLIDIVSEYQKVDECKLRLEEAAFNSGYDVNSVLFVAALNIRDKVIEDLGFKRDDIDKHDPKKNTPKV